MMTAQDAWAQLYDALTRMAALQAQRAAEVQTGYGKKRKQHWLDAYMHVQKMRVQQDRVTEAFAALTSHPSAINGIDSLMEALLIVEGADNG